MKKVTVFNWLWYYVVKWLIPVGGKKKQIVDKYYWRMRAQWGLARLFGGVKGVIAGDSNGARLDSFKVMRQFDRIVVNWARPGTTAHDWHIFFTSSSWGHKIKTRMYSVKQIFNIGGNYVLLGITGMARDGLKWLHTWFPDSYNCTIPPIHGDIMAQLCKLAGIKDGRNTEDYYKVKVPEVNKIIREFWGSHCIDLYALFGDDKGNPLPGVEQDPVHFSDIAVEFIQQIFDAVI
jgi:hypothetical protein